MRSTETEVSDCGLILLLLASSKGAAGANRVWGRLRRIAWVGREKSGQEPSEVRLDLVQEAAELSGLCGRLAGLCGRQSCDI